MRNRVLELTTDSLPHFLKVEDYVLLEIYAPWCPHCVSFAPEYESIVPELPGVLVARLDGTTNQPPIQLDYFPTIVLMSSRFGSPLIYSGVRRANNIVKFVNDAITLSR